MHMLETPLKYVINLTGSSLRKMEASGITRKNYKTVAVTMVILQATFISINKF